MTDKLVPSSDALVQELRSLIEATRGRVAQTVNSELVALYWQVGKRLREEVLGDERAAYGEQVVAEVAKALTAEFGRGFSKRNLHYMARFAEVFPDAEIVHALRSQLSWTHFRELLELTEGSVRVASYLTELPPRKLLERKLLESIEHARARAVPGERLALPDADG